MSAIQGGQVCDGSETGKCPEWQRELTVNQPPHGFEGSSPSFPTIDINSLDWDCFPTLCCFPDLGSIAVFSFRPELMPCSVDRLGSVRI